MSQHNPTFGKYRLRGMIRERINRQGGTINVVAFSVWLLEQGYYAKAILDSQIHLGFKVEDGMVSLR